MRAEPDAHAAAGFGTAATGEAIGPAGILIESFATAERGLSRQEQLGEAVRDDRGTLLLAWRAPRALLVSRSDAALPGFECATEALSRERWPVLVRRSGGLASPVSSGTLQVAIARRSGAGVNIDSLYRQLTTLIGDVLAGVGLVAEIGERPDAFCPGRYDMGVGPRKFAGLSQHWRPFGGSMIATTAATLIVDEDTDELARVIELFYREAGSGRRCLPSAMTDVRRAMPRSLLRGEPLMAELCRRLKSFT